ncbi:RagB/SusD family nutrient uptake outer membrane protein [uncultured Alistipes sp.]|jgi:susD family|uniref:RagB/SusD family nutrient uptake outer membrane protein n=1 Tax=uncultured Alistipes sp. TaxID=538949 RepID=UPI0025CF8F35|nr:RagB/SusD family nutrient uptake outer membrane protein [uncultured Alistipes sp.]
MKKILYSIISIAALAMASCNLDFSPTDSGSGDKLLKEASTAITSINGVYRSMWVAGWSTTGNTHQCFGVSAYNLALDAMADDLIMQAQGNGWFWHDHTYNVKSNYTNSAFRSYDVWYANYKWIANVNYIIDRELTMEGDEVDVAYVVGQAYAIRAYCYLSLATWFSRAPYNPMRGTSRWNEACVPVYTSGTTIDTGGAPRSTLRQVYDQIDKDIDKAIELLEKGKENSLVKTLNKSHINLYVALGIKSRACLVEGDWDGAYAAARRVIDEGGYAVGTKGDLMSGMNSLDKANVMWGAGIQVADQTGGYAGFFPHMDNQNGSYAESAPKLINKQLYNRLGTNDIRRDWWDPANTESPYLGQKFKFTNVATRTGDYPYMRVEEMYFTAAEAALRSETLAGNIQIARDLMNAVMVERDPQYNANNRSGMNLGATTTTWTGSQLEDILIQRRLELWGEYGRLFDVRRLGQGIDRRADDGFASDCLAGMNRRNVDLTKPDTYDWILTIPQDEINANPNINEGDQNP